MQNIPLSALYNPLQVMFEQVSIYEKLLDDITQAQKDQMKNRVIIDKLIAIQCKQQEQVEEKVQLELLYQYANLTKEQHNHLINADVEIDDEFYRIYTILQEQETLAMALQQYDNRDDKPSIFRSSLTENIDQVRKLALNKVVGHLKRGYDSIQLSELKHIKQLFGSQIHDQIVFVLRYKFSSQFTIQLGQLAQKEQSHKVNLIQEFITQYIHETQLLQKDLEFLEVEQEMGVPLLKQIIDNLSVDYFQQLENVIKQMDNYFEIFEVRKLIDSVATILTNIDNSFDCLKQITKINTHLVQLKDQSLALLTHQLQITRFNIAQFTSYQPLRDHFSKILKLIESNDKLYYSTIFESLYSPVHQLIRWKLQQNQNNRSSKIFCVNVLTLVEQEVESFKFPEIAQYIKEKLAENQQLLNLLIGQLTQENIKEAVDKIKVAQLMAEIQKGKEIQANKDKFKQYLKALTQFNDLVFRNEIMFEVHLVMSKDDRMKLVTSISQDFVLNYYQPIYSQFCKLVDNKSSILEFNQENIEAACVKFAVTSKDMDKIPTYIQDSGSYQINLMNMMSIQQF